MTAGHVAFGERISVTSGVYWRAIDAAARASDRYRSVAAPAGPTITTTFGTPVEERRGERAHRRDDPDAEHGDQDTDDHPSHDGLHSTTGNPL